MYSEEKIIISFLFKRSGKQHLTESELYLPLALELKWFSTQEAHRFVASVVEKKLVIKKDGVLTPAFNVETVQIPVGFTPTKKLFSDENKKETKQNIVDEIVEMISKKTEQDPQQIYDEITKTATEKKILREVAAVFVAQNYAVALEGFLDLVQTSIFAKENTK